MLLCPSLLAVLAFQSPVGPPNPNYDLRLRIEPAAKKLEVEGTCELPAIGKEYDKIHWRFAPTLTMDSVEVVSPAAAAGPLTPGTQTVLTLKGKVGPQEKLRLKFKYHGGEKPDFVFYVGPDCAFGCGTNAKWYPVVAPNIEGVTYGWYPVATGSMTIDLPETWLVAGTGGKSKLAASAGRSLWKIDVKVPCDLGFAAGPFVSYSSPGKLPVTVFRLKEDPEAQKFARRLRDVVECLEKVYGKLPYPEFAVVEIPNEAARAAQFGGVSMAGAMVGGDSFFASGFNTAFFGHEVGHQWWGNAVRSWGKEGNYMLSEAMAQYGSLRCVEALDPPAMAAVYRRSGYPNYIGDQCGEEYLLNTAAGLDDELIDLPNSPMSHTLSDSKGFLMYHMLDRHIGRAAFDSVLKRVVREKSFGHISFAEFREWVDQATSRPMKRFWDQWLRQKGAPVVDMMWVPAAEGVRVTLKQQAPFYELDIPVRVTTEDGSAAMKWLVLERGEQSYVLPSKRRVKEVELDPDFEVLMMTSAKKAEVDAMGKVTLARRQVGWGQTEEARPLLLEAVAATEPDAHGVKFTASYYLAWVHLNVDKKPEEAIRVLEPAMALGSRVERRVPNALLVLARAYDQLGKSVEAKRYARAVIVLAEAKAEESILIGPAREILSK